MIQTNIHALVERIVTQGAETRHRKYYKRVNYRACQGAECYEEKQAEHVKELRRTGFNSGGRSIRGSLRRRDVSKILKK